MDSAKCGSLAWAWQYLSMSSPYSLFHFTRTWENSGGIGSEVYCRQRTEKELYALQGVAPSRTDNRRAMKSRGELGCS